MKEPEDYPHGYLLNTVLYHCGIKIKIIEKLRLFISEQPFEVDHIVDFVVKSKVFDFPSMSVHKLINMEGIVEEKRIISRL